MSYGAPEEKKAKLDLDMNKKKSVEPPKDDRNVAPVTKTETESAEMVEARQRAEIEKVFEIARAQAAAKALEPKSKAGLKTKSQIEKRKTDKEAFKAQQKKKEKQVPSKPIVDSSNVQPQSNKENENKKAMPTVPPAPPSKEKLCHDLERKNIPVNLKEIFAGDDEKNSILESLPSSLAVRRVKSSQTKVLLEAKQSLAEKQTQSATVKKPAQFEKESNDVQWAEAKRKAAMLGDIKKKEEFLKSRVADLRRKLQDQKKMKDPKENCNNTPIVLPDEIIATKVPKEKKKAQDDFKTMQKSETCVDPFEEAAKKAAKLEEIKQREQTLIQRLAMLTEKLNKKKRLAAAVEKSPEICIKEEVAEVKPDSLGGRDGLLGGQDSQEVDHVVEASNPKLTTVEEKMARLQLLKKLKEEKRKKALVEKRVMKEKKVMEEKKALEEEKRAIENKKTMEEKKASDEKKALEEKKSLEEKRALMEKKAMEEKKALEEEKAKEEKAKEEKKALEEEKRAIEEKRVVEEKRASEGKKSIEEKEKMALEEKKAFDEKKKALEEKKVMKETEKDINKAGEKIVSEEKIKREAERRLRNIQAKEAALQFKRDLDAKREIEKARLKEEEEEIKRKEINAAEMLDHMRWASFPIPSNFSASKSFLGSNFGLIDNLSYQDGRWRWLPRRRRSRGRRSGGT